MVDLPTPDDLGLKGRTILVTGAAQGIGQETAIWLSALGAKVVVADIKDCNDTAAACRNEAIATQLDLSRTDEIEPFIEQVDAEHGSLYGVVNCAGLLLRRSTEETTLAEIEKQTAVNQYGTFFLARAAHAVLKKHGEGRIVLYTSQGAFTGGFNGSMPYAMNKAGVTALVKSLARQAAPDGITVNAVAPGAINTEMMRTGMSEQDFINFQKMIPAGRFGETAELAGPTVFLMSAWAQYVTGTTMHVNGGQLMV